MAKRNKDDYFRSLRATALGLGGLGVGVGVVGAISARTPAGLPTVMPAVGAVASFAPLVVTGVGGYAALQAVKRLKQKRNRSSRF